MHGDVADLSEARRRQFLSVIRLDPFGRPVDKRVQDDKVSRRQLLLEGAAGRGGQDVGHSEVLQGQHVGAVVHLGRAVLVARTVPVKGER